MAGSVHKIEGQKERGNPGESLLAAPAHARLYLYMKVKQTPIAEVKLYDANPRQNEKAVDVVARSLTEFGWQQPIVVDTAGTIIVGHTRLLAAQSLGMKQVPVVVADKLTPEQARAYRIADNKSAEYATWDMDLLEAEVRTLEQMEVDLATLCIDPKDLEEIMGAFDIAVIDAPSIKSGDRDPIQQMTFTLHDDQVEMVKKAMAKARDAGAFGDTGNENNNGNALARIAEAYLG